MSISHDLKATLALSQHQRERLAAKLLVSVSTIDRWAAGTALPGPRHETALAALITEMSPDKIDKVARELHQSLADAREVMHRHGLTSSRNDAIDQLVVLLLLQLYNLKKDSVGTRPVVDQLFSDSITGFRSYLSDSFAKPLCESLETSISFLENKQEYRSDLQNCFSIPFDEMVLSEVRKNSHFLHEVFIAFLSSSFHDEKEFAQYMTPPEIVDFMVSLALHFHNNKDPSQLNVLDPSCGTGSFLTTFAERLTFLPDEPTLNATSRPLKNNVFGIDTNERMARIASVSMVASDLAPSSIVLDNSLDPASEEAKAVLCNQKFDLILTNPPFGAEHSRGKHGGKGIPSELLYLEKYINWLADDGVVAVIVPDSVVTNKGVFARARHSMLINCHILAIISLPSITFSASGTTTKTSILVFQRKLFRTGQEITFVSSAENVGFSVLNRGSIRKRVRNDKSDLPEILDCLAGSESDCGIGKWIKLEPHHDRWDAQFWMSPLSQESNIGTSAHLTSVGSIATLVRDKADPKKLGDDTFNYIEISCVSGDLLRVSATSIPTIDAPSRARRRVRAGDVLISTVRPERRTVGVVPPRLDGAICSTGFGVLRPNGISPYVLAAALRSDHATAQLIGVSSGVAYPVFDPEALPNLELDLMDEAWRSKCANYGQALEQMEIFREEALSC